MRVKGYKVFNADWTCRGFQYVVGETFEEDVIPSCYDKGFHFCTKASDCFNYYPFDPNNKVAEVEAIGEIDTSSVDSICCTNKIRIVRELSWNEFLEIVNTGKGCTGLRNKGNYNSGNHNNGNRNSGDYNNGDYNNGNHNNGNYNSGDYNSGNRNNGNRNKGNYNSGNRNSGDYNSGYYNTGDWNSGDRNIGDWNSGNRNIGDYNSGDWNKTNFSSGCFNTKEQKILMFDKPSNWSLNDWWDSEARRLLNQIQHNVLKWICLEDMTDEEKEQHPEHKTTGGYLKELDRSECNQIWWNNLSEMERNIIRNIPNFDEVIFEEITGIKIEKEDRNDESKNNEKNTQENQEYRKRN